MKKLMIVLAAVALAIGAQGAQAKWNVTGVAADPISTAWTGYKLYLCDASVYTATVLAEDLAAGNFNKLSTDGFVKATANTVQQGTASFAKMTDATYTDDVFTAGTSYTLYTLVLNAEGSAATYFTIGKDVTASAPGTGYLTETHSNLTAGAQTAWTEVAPEPTSGLMMLLGMGVLALRRRRA